MGGEELSDAERDQLLELCRQRLDAFRMQPGEEVFAHRSRHHTLISGSIKVRVLTRAKGRCEGCGEHEHQRALEVDHIVPRNQGRLRRPQQHAVPLLPLQCQLGAAGERTGAVHRRCRSGDA